MMSGLYLAAEVLGASAVVSVISCSSVLVLTAEVSSVFVITVSAALTLKGLLGTLTPPQVTASVCLTAELGVYEQEYTWSPLLFIFTSMGTPSASWENKSSQSWVSAVQIGLRRSYLLADARPNLCDDSQRSVSGVFGLDGELCRFVYDTARLLQSWSIRPDLHTSTCVKNKPNKRTNACPLCNNSII